MQNQWQSLLNNLNPISTHEVSPDFNYIACLDEFETLSFKGPDRLKFLQGQMTCDFTDISEKLLLGANCNLKGRASATFYGFDDNETTTLILPTGQAAYLKSLLEKYILFSNANIIPNNNNKVIVGLIGEHSLAMVDSQPLTNQPLAANQFITHNSAGHKINLGKVNDTDLYVCQIDTSIAERWLGQAQTNDQLIIANQTTWDLQQIKQGISHVTPDSQDKFLPQEMNYDLINGISFKKGCYKGQEIIARLHYRGSYKQRACRFQCQTDSATPLPGTAIFAAGSDRSCGHVIQSARLPNNDIELLIVTKLTALESESLHLEQNDGPILHNLSLPYAITN